MIHQLATSSACGDNWQVKIGKEFQDGKSGIMQRGTAFLMKKNKCMTIPVGTVMSSPSGLCFTMLDTDRINAYIIVVKRTLFPNQHDEDKREYSLDKRNSEKSSIIRGLN